MTKVELIEGFLNGNRKQLWSKLNSPNMPKDCDGTVITSETLLLT